MTTSVEVRKLVRPLLARHPDLVLAGRLVAIRPIAHIVKGIFIDRTSRADAYRPIWAVNFLFEPNGSFSFNWGERLYPSIEGFWRLGDPAFQEDLFRIIENEILPLLRPVSTIDDFLSFVGQGSRFPYQLSSAHHRKVYIDIARGDLDSARAICATMASKREMWMRSILHEEATRILDEVYPLLLADDQPALARLLHQWEAATVRKLKLEGIWQSSPFPLERAEGEAFALPSP